MERYGVMTPFRKLSAEAGRNTEFSTGSTIPFISGRAPTSRREFRLGQAVYDKARPSQPTSTPPHRTLPRNMESNAHLVTKVSLTQPADMGHGHVEAVHVGVAENHPPCAYTTHVFLQGEPLPRGHSPILPAAADLCDINPVREG